MKHKDSEILRIVISHIDYLLICHIRNIRITKGLSQIELSRKLNLADGFVSKVEAFSERSKYSIRHLKLLADALDCTIADLIPNEHPKYDFIALDLKKSHKVNKDGIVSSKMFQTIECITPIESTKYPLKNKPS